MCPSGLCNHSEGRVCRDGTGMRGKGGTSRRLIDKLLGQLAIVSIRTRIYDRSKDIFEARTIQIA